MTMFATFSYVESNVGTTLRIVEGGSCTVTVARADGERDSTAARIPTADAAELLHEIRDIVLKLPAAGDGDLAFAFGEMSGGVDRRRIGRADMSDDALALERKLRSVISELRPPRMPWETESSLVRAPQTTPAKPDQVRPAPVVRWGGAFSLASIIVLFALPPQSAKHAAGCIGHTIQLVEPGEYAEMMALGFAIGNALVGVAAGWTRGSNARVWRPALLGAFVQATMINPFLGSWLTTLGVVALLVVVAEGASRSKIGQLAPAPEPVA